MTKFKRKRKQKLNPSAIFVADWHIRESQPVCRIDDFWIAQDKKVNFIFDLARKHQCPILVSGDIGHKPRWSCRLLEWFISKVDKDIKIIVTPGQHDLINHRLSLWEHSAIGVLYAAGSIDLCGFEKFPNSIELDDFHLHAFPYGKDIENIELADDSRRNIAMCHMMVIENKKLWPGQEAPKGHQLLKKFPEYDLILTGDNHQSFTAEYEVRKLVNPGSVMRTTTDQENHKPRVYLWYAETNDIECVYLPIEKGVISREHIDIAKSRENRNEALINRVNNDVEVELSYEKNLENYFAKYRTRKGVKDKVWQSVEG